MLALLESSIPHSYVSFFTVTWLLQADATRLGAPVIEGCELDCECKGLDVLQLVSPSAATDSFLAPQQRLKLTGSARFAGRVTPAAEPSDGELTPGRPSFAGAHSAMETTYGACA